jgi:HEAT repeat protein
MDAYANWALNSPIKCGAARYEIVVDLVIYRFDSGLDGRDLGYRFRADDLLQFLQRRIDGPNREQSFEIRYPDAVQARAEQTELQERRLAWSPWDRDLATAMDLLVGIEHKPVYPLLRALLKDPSDNLRRQVIISLGRLAPLIPSAVDDFVPFIDDKDLSTTAAAALALAGSNGISAIVKTMDHENYNVRNQAVHSLARMEPKDAVAGLRAALLHKDAEIREWAFAVLIDRQGRRADSFDEELLDAIIRCLADDDEQLRLQATVAIRNFGMAAKRSRPALIAAKEKHPSMQDAVDSALFAVEGVAPPKSKR